MYSLAYWGVIRRWLLCFLFAVGMHRDGQADDADVVDLRRRLHEEAPIGWKKLRQLMVHSTGKISYRDQIVDKSDPNKSTEPRERSVEFAIAGDTRRRAVADIPQKEILLAGCRNPSYSFKLIGAPTTNRDFKILQVKAGAPPSDSLHVAPVDAQFTALVFPVIYGPFNIHGFDLGELTSNKNFEYKNIEEVSSDGMQSLVKIDFDFLDPYANAWLRKCKMVLDPNNGWAVRSSLIINESLPGAFSVDITYNETAEPQTGLRPPQQVIARNTDQALNPLEAKTHEIQQFTLDRMDFADVDDIQFTLTAFGLPEPGTRAAAGRHWMLVGLSGGVILLIIAFLRRSRATQA